MLGSEDVSEEVSSRRASDGSEGSSDEVNGGGEVVGEWEEDDETTSRQRDKWQFI